MDAGGAYSAGLSAYDSYEASRASGASEAESVGAVAGAITGAAGCAAAGAAVLSPLCATVGSAVGKIVGSWLGGGGEPPDNTAAICAVVDADLAALGTLAERAGVTVPFDSLRYWFADAAWRAILPVGWNIEGEIGKPGAAILAGGYRVPLKPTGSPASWPGGVTPTIVGTHSPFYQSAKQRDIAWMHRLFWDSGPGRRCIQSAVDVESLNSAQKRSLVIGIAAVGARLASMGGGKTALEPRGLGGAWVLVGGALGLGGWWYARNRK